MNKNQKLNSFFRIDFFVASFWCDLTISRSTIRRRRQENRRKTAAEIEKNFKINIYLIKSTPSHFKWTLWFWFWQVQRGTIHWDSKMMQDIHGNEIVDRLAIVLSQNSGSQLSYLAVMISEIGFVDDLMWVVFTYFSIYIRYFYTCCFLRITFKVFSLFQLANDGNRRLCIQKYIEVQGKRWQMLCMLPWMNGIAWKTSLLRYDEYQHRSNNWSVHYFATKIEIILAVPCLQTPYLRDIPSRSFWS